MKLLRNSTIAFLLLILNQTAHSQALHWLSQPGVDVGLVSNNNTYEVKISANGRYISFASHATNLVENDTNRFADVFVRDMQTGVTQMVSVTSTGEQATDGFLKAISAPTSDGRYVAFVSSSSVFPNSNSVFDEYLYVKDLQTGALINHSDYEGDSYFEVLGDIELSDDGQYVVFETYYAIDPLHIGFDDQVYRKHLNTDSFELLSVSHDGLTQSDDDSELADVSDNGRYVLISSRADNLTTDVINNFGENLFVRDTQMNTNTLVNITPSGDSSSESNVTTQEAKVSNSGSVAFKSIQSDLVADDNNERADVFYFNNGSVSRVNLTSGGNEITGGGPSIVHVTISGDGSRIVFSEYSDELFPQFSNEAYDLYSYETATGNVSLISRSVDGTKANSYSLYPEVSTNGNRVVFLSWATDLTEDTVIGDYYDVFQYSFNSDTLRLETLAGFHLNTILSDVYFPRVSSDQLSVVYTSRTPNLVDEPIDTVSNDLFLLDRNTNTHTMIASNVDGFTDISPSGQYISFVTQYFPPEGVVDLGATNVFLYNRQNDTFTLIDEGGENKVNDNGIVVFNSSKNIDPNDSNGALDVYAFNPIAQSVHLISHDMSGLAATTFHIGNFDIGGSDNNTWIVFSSSNPDIVLNDTNGVYDVFMKKFPNGDIFRISETVAGVEGNSSSYWGCSVSEDGNWAAFITGATNLTVDDHSLASPDQVMVFDRLNHQFTLASVNDEGLPASDLGTVFIEAPSISDSGRYVSYSFLDTGSIDSDFAGDSDSNRDIVLFDRVTQSSKIVTKHIDGTHSEDEAYAFSMVTEDLTLSPPLVGVVFAADGGDLSGLDNHPGHNEAYLYQQGGPDLSLTISVQGSGTVIGTSGINCSGECQYSFPLGAELTLTAVADSGIDFSYWQEDFGICNDNNNPCHLILDREKTLIATFSDSNDLIFENGYD